MMTLKEAKAKLYTQIERDQLDPELLAFTLGQLQRVKGYVAQALLEALEAEDVDNEVDAQSTGG